MWGEFNKNRNRDLGVDADVAYEIEAEGEHLGYIFLKFIDSHVLAIEAVELLSEKEQLVETIIKAFMTYTKKEKLFVHGFEHVNYSATSCRASCFDHYCMDYDTRNTTSYIMSTGVRFG